MKKKPMKTKRYADEGLVEEDFKKKGLDSSKDDRVGFFERLRMGNIDSPSSEAYRRYGAGRGRTDADIASRMQDRAVNAAAPNQDISRMGRTVPDGQVSSPFLMGRVPIGGPSEAPMESRRLPITIEGDYSGKPSEAGVIKPAVRRSSSSGSLPRNKKASGYQIDEDGPAKIGSQNTFNFDLRKKSQAAPTTRSGGARTRAGTPVSNESDGRTRAGTKATGGDAIGPLAVLAALAGAGALSKRARQGGTKPVDDRASSFGKNPRLMGIDPMMEGDLERMAGEGGPNFKKGGKTKARAKPMQKFASGGSVSSASKRGDGIAQKGKTRGRIC